jgi:hypothetical protein
MILRRNKRDIVTNARRSSCKVPNNRLRFLKKLKFSKKKYSNIKFHDIHPVGAGLVHAEGQMGGQRQTNMTKLTVTFRKFCGIAQEPGK